MLKKYHFIDNDLNIHGMVCVYVYSHATCNNDESNHDTCYVLQFCLPLQLIAACYLQIDMFA